VALPRHSQNQHSARADLGGRFPVAHTRLSHIIDHESDSRSTKNKMLLEFEQLKGKLKIPVFERAHRPNSNLNSEECKYQFSGHIGDSWLNQL
jgi:hypothetical protein